MFQGRFWSRFEKRVVKNKFKTRWNIGEQTLGTPLADSAGKFTVSVLPTNSSGRSSEPDFFCQACCSPTSRDRAPLFTAPSHWSTWIIRRIILLLWIIRLFQLIGIPTLCSIFLLLFLERSRFFLFGGFRETFVFNLT